MLDLILVYRVPWYTKGQGRNCRQGTSARAFSSKLFADGVFATYRKRSRVFLLVWVELVGRCGRAGNLSGHRVYHQRKTASRRTRHQIAQEDGICFGCCFFCFVGMDRRRKVDCSGHILCNKLSFLAFLFAFLHFPLLDILLLFFDDQFPYQCRTRYQTVIPLRSSPKRLSSMQQDSKCCWGI